MERTIQLSGDNNYDIILMPQQPIDGPSWEQSVFIHFNLSGNKHDGKIVDLTKKEDNPEGWYWYVKYYLENPKLDLVGKGEIDEFRPLGKGSTLYIKRLKKDSYDYEISFTLKFLDGVEGTKITHIVRGNYTGKLKSKVDDKGNPLEDGDIWIDNLKEYK
ncbi:MAG: hypothetical protein GX102_09225 [Porphyromonadaceae bacterium]|nr:hypothetical protein [Porphyromonadaceae bacterium]